MSAQWGLCQGEGRSLSREEGGLCQADPPVWLRAGGMHPTGMYSCSNCTMQPINKQRCAQKITFAIAFTGCTSRETGQSERYSEQEKGKVRKRAQPVDSRGN